MALSQKFSQRVAQINTRDELKALIASIDETKRSIRSQLSQLSSEPREGMERGRARQAKIRRMKDKMSFLIEEREHVRVKLGTMKAQKKQLHVATSRRPTLNDAIVAVLMVSLSEEEFLAMELKAVGLLNNE